MIPDLIDLLLNIEYETVTLFDGKKATQKTYADYSKVIKLINSLRKIEYYKIGEPIIHSEYGIGTFKGFEKVKIKNQMKFVAIIKFENETIYVDINSVDKLTRPKKDEI
jgi:transcription-repair coupling factor (superfamily II helicase)